MTSFLSLRSVSAGLLAANVYPDRKNEDSMPLTEPGDRQSAEAFLPGGLALIDDSTGIDQ
jgi:hypothetical protein